MLKKLRRGIAGGLLIAAIAVFSPPAAHADAGIPMLPVQYPELLLFILPVILIETLYLMWQLNTPPRRTAVAVAGVNLFTMALGYPLAFGLFELLNWMFAFPAQNASIFSQMWEVPLWISLRMFPGWAGMSQTMWPVLAVWVVLLLPSFLLSGLVKAWMVEWYDLLNYKGKTRPAVWVANRLSYFFLAVTGCVLLYMTYSRM